MFSEMRSRLENDVGPSWLVQFNGREEGDALGELQGVPEKLCCSNQLQPMTHIYLAFSIYFEIFKVLKPIQKIYIYI